MIINLPSRQTDNLPSYIENILFLFSTRKDERRYYAVRYNPVFTKYLLSGRVEKKKKTGVDRSRDLVYCEKLH